MQLVLCHYQFVCVLDVPKSHLLEKIGGNFVARVDVSQKAFDSAMSFHQAAHRSETETPALIRPKQEDPDLIALCEIDRTDPAERRRLDEVPRLVRFLSDEGQMLGVARHFSMTNVDM